MNLVYATKGGIPSELPKEYTPSVIRDDLLAAIYEVRTLRQAIQAYLIDVTKDITGIVPPANLGTGAASATTILSGASTYIPFPSSGIPIPGPRRFGADFTDGSAIRTMGIGAGFVTPGSIVTDSGGYWQRKTTAAAANSNVQFVGNAFFTWADHNPIWQFYVRTPADISAVRMLFGIWSTAPTNTDTPGGKFMAFRYSTGAADPGWVGITRDGTTQLTTGNVANIAASTAYTLTIKATGSGTSVSFTVNSGTAQTLSPTASIQGTAMFSEMDLWTLAATALNLDLGKHYIEAT